MPNLDVSELLYDPDFATTFDVIRSTQAVDIHGMASNAQVATFGVVGVVTANDDISLLRTPEGERLNGSITIHTTFRLTNGSGATDADVVVWNGRQYIVTSVGDWGQFGAGFIMAICSLQQLNPNP